VNAFNNPRSTPNNASQNFGFMLTTPRFDLAHEKYRFTQRDFLPRPSSDLLPENNNVVLPCGTFERTQEYVK
jgi:hypothetical protein